MLPRNGRPCEPDRGGGVTVTLVVARSWPSGRVRVTADLRVTDAQELRRGYPSAVLKNVILSETVVVAAAGNAELALHALRALPDRPERAAEVLPALEKSSAAAGAGDCRTEFLVAGAGDGLWRVTASGARDDGRASWIGDAAAYAVYQHGYHESPVGPPLIVPGISPPGLPPAFDTEMQEVLRMGDGIHRLDATGSVPTVGEAFITASATPSRPLHYEQQAFLAADHEQVIEPRAWVAADWGTVARGGFGYATLVPEQPGIGMLGLYFPHAGLGLLYHPLRRDEPFVYPRMSHAAFRACVLAEHGIAINGPAFGE
jgi:hypothetical protein